MMRRGIDGFKNVILNTMQDFNDFRNTKEDRHVVRIMMNVSDSKRSACGLLAFDITIMPCNWCDDLKVGANALFSNLWKRQQNNSRPHVGHRVLTCLNSEGVQQLPQPSRSQICHPLNTSGHDLLRSWTATSL
ncbi:hypothetical protein TNCV_3631561 [Trichonephila clavipes]|nr:hypothetical protein TNCV_3631561 [Trichonephila clavipes]